MNKTEQSKNANRYEDEDEDSLFAICYRIASVY